MVKDRLIELIEDASGKSVSESTTFDELGIDSLDFLELLQEIRDKIAPISDQQAIKAQTVGELITAVEWSSTK